MPDRQNQRGKRIRTGDERKNVIQRAGDAVMTGVERLGQSYGAPQSVQMERLASMANRAPQDRDARDAMRQYRNVSEIDFDAPAREVREARGAPVDPAPRGNFDASLARGGENLAAAPRKIGEAIDRGRTTMAGAPQNIQETLETGGQNIDRAQARAFMALTSTMMDRERLLAQSAGRVPRGTPETTAVASPDIATLQPPTQLAQTTRNIIDLERRREILARERGVADPEVRQLTESIVALRRELPRERGIPMTREGMDAMVASGRQVSDSLAEQDRLTPPGPSRLEQEQAFGARFRDEAEMRRLGVNPMEFERMNSLRGGASRRFAEIDAGRVRAQQDIATEGQISDAQRQAVAETGELPPRPTVPDFRAMREREINEQLEAARAREMSGLEGMARAQEMRDDPGGALATANVAARDATRAATRQVQGQIAQEQLDRDDEERRFMTDMQNAQREAAIRAMGPQDEFGGMTAEGTLPPSREDVTEVRRRRGVDLTLTRAFGDASIGMTRIQDAADSMGNSFTVLGGGGTKSARIVSGIIERLRQLDPQDATVIAQEILRRIPTDALPAINADAESRSPTRGKAFMELQRIAGQAG